jgi:hypothetical protein
LQFTTIFRFYNNFPSVPDPLFARAKNANPDLPRTAEREVGLGYCWRNQTTMMRNASYYTSVIALLLLVGAQSGESFTGRKGFIQLHRRNKKNCWSRHDRYRCRPSSVLLFSDRDNHNDSNSDELMSRHLDNQEDELQHDSFWSFTVFLSVVNVIMLSALIAAAGGGDGADGAANNPTVDFVQETATGVLQQQRRGKTQPTTEVDPPWMIDGSAGFFFF